MRLGTALLIAVAIVACQNDRSSPSVDRACADWLTAQVEEYFVFHARCPTQAELRLLVADRLGPPTCRPDRARTLSVSGTPASIRVCYDGGGAKASPERCSGPIVCALGDT